MAFGTHWEWRAFGELSDAMIIQLSALDKHYGPDDIGLAHTDSYLWSRDCVANVKLRDDSLKFKRLLRADGSLELWTEEPAESFDFPLSSAALRLLCLQMRVQAPPDSSAWAESRHRLLQALGSFDPPVSLVPMRKFRVQYDLSLADETIIIELAELHEPVHIWSVGIEGEDVLQQATGKIDEEKSNRSLRNLHEVRSRLQLATFPEEKNYLQMLAKWCGGG